MSVSAVTLEPRLGEGPDVDIERFGVGVVETIATTCLATVSNDFQAARDGVGFGREAGLAGGFREAADASSSSFRTSAVELVAVALEHGVVGHHIDPIDVVAGPIWRRELDRAAASSASDSSTPGRSLIAAIAVVIACAVGEFARR